MLDKAAALLQEAMRDKPHDPDLASAMSDHGAMIRDNRLMAEGSRRYITGYQEMTENPAKKGGQFCFSMTDDVLTLNLYRLCIASLEEGMRCWQTVKPRIQHMHPTLKDELRMNINVIGLPHLLQEVPELDGALSLAKLDIRDVEL